MTTYLFYQSIAYMGSRAGEFLAAYERASPLARKAQKSMYELLGGVEVSVLIDGDWKEIGTIEEQGPIVNDTHVLAVKDKGKFTKVKLSMTKGLWRIDQVAVCTLVGTAEPVRIQPDKLLNKGLSDQELLRTLNDPEVFLVNNPGTSYTLTYTLPEMENPAVFLRTQGYYTEWMRSEWLDEESPEMVQLIIHKPGEWLRQMAPRYKRVESEMEAYFWESKFSYDGK
jgi:hypothetical protein